MDIEKYAVCPECGGWLTYVEFENKLICDTCDYERKDAH